MSLGSVKTDVRVYLELLLTTALVAVFVRTYVVSTYRVPNDAMAPLLLPGDFIVAFKPSYGWEIPFTNGYRMGRRPPVRGDVVLLRSPQEDGGDLVKRVAGLPGDRIAILGHRLFVNDRTAFFQPTVQPDALGPIVVPPNGIFVLNDGLVSQTDLEGRIVLIWMSFEWRSRLPEIRWSRIGRVQ